MQSICSRKALHRGGAEAPFGIPGKGPNWVEPYDPNKTIGQVIQNITKHYLGEQKINMISVIHIGLMTQNYQNMYIKWDYLETLFSLYMSFFEGL